MSRPNDQAADGPSRSTGNILARFALPTSFCVLSIAYFLPQTWSNIEGRAAVVESQQFPALRDAREKARSLIAQARGRP